MKKEIFSVCLLLIMLTAAFMNIHYLNKLTDEISQLVSESKDAAASGEWEKAVSTAEYAEKLWDEKTGYTHVVLRHSEIDTVSDVLYDFISHIYEQDNDASHIAADKVIYHLDSIYRMEQVRFGSIF